MIKALIPLLSILMLPITSVLASEGTGFDDYLRRLNRNPTENAEIINNLSDELKFRLVILRSEEDSKYQNSKSETERRRLQEEQCARDEILARQLADEYKPRNIVSVPQTNLPRSIALPTMGDIFNEHASVLTGGQRARVVQMKDCLVEICQRLASTGSMQNTHLDVHGFNAMVKPFSQVIMEINERIGLNNTHSCETAIAKLRSLDNSNSYKFEIDKLSNYLNSTNQEEETALNSHHILSYMVDFLERMGTQEDRTEFFLRMRENTLTNGGCYPGYIGRVLAFNMRVVLHRFTRVRLTTV